MLSDELYEGGEGAKLDREEERTDFGADLVLTEAELGLPSIDAQVGRDAGIAASAMGGEDMQNCQAKSSSKHVDTPESD